MTCWISYLPYSLDPIETVVIINFYLTGSETTDREWLLLIINDVINMID